jgi:WD40 repeat protein
VDNTPAPAIDRDNPWPGLASFTEDAREFFFGRERETDELSRLVRRQTLTVLFGQSGLGKSSLLQAGLFPLLREGDLLPLYLRLDHDPGAPPLVDQVKAALAAAFAAAKADAPAFRPDETLWEYFHRKDVDIWSSKNRLLTPVLAFDQFEEIFTLGRADNASSARSRAFLAELSCLVENRPPASVQEKLDRGELAPDGFNFEKPSCQVILSLREDFLPDLEGLKREMPALIHNRLRLKKLNGTAALDIVQMPAPQLLAPGVGEKIVEFVAGARGGSAERLAELDVEPPLLSVICRELNERRRALGQQQITADLVSGNRREILSDFYERSVFDLPREMRAFIEDRLLTKSGFRDNLALETALEAPGVTRPLLDTLVARRLLRIEDRLGVQRVELTHDVLAEVIRASRDARKQRLALEEAQGRERRVLAEAARRTRNLRLLVGGLVSVIVALCAAGIYGLHTRQLEYKRMSRTDVGIASSYLDQGKTAEGLAYLLRAAAKDPQNPTIAPRLASILTSRNFLLPEGAPLQLGSRVLGSLFSANGDHLLVLCEDGTLAVVNTKNGNALRNRLSSPPRGQQWAAIAPTIVGILCEDGVVRVIDRETGRVVRDIRFNRKPQFATGTIGDDPVLYVQFEDQMTGAAEIATGRTRLLPIKATTQSMQFSNEGRWFAYSEEPRSELQVWDALAMERRAVLSLGLVNEFKFSPDEKRLVTLSLGEKSSLVLRLWSLPECEPAAEPQIVQNAVGSQPNTGIRFSDDGRFFLVANAQGVQVFDAETGAKVGPYYSGAGLLVGIGQTGQDIGGRSPFNRTRGFAAEFTPDGRQFIVNTPAGLETRDVATGKPTATPMPNPGTLRSLSLAEGGRMLLTTSSDGFARLWDTTTGELLAEPTLQQDIDLDASVSPDGRQLVIGTVGGAIYRLRSGRGVARPLLIPRTATLPEPFLPAPPSRLLRLGLNDTRIFDVASGRDIAGGFTYPAQIAPFDGSRRGFAIRPDGGAMVVRTTAGQWQAWVLGPGGIGQATPLDGAPPGTGTIRFSPTGDRVAIVAAADDQTVRIWNIRTGKAVGAPLAYDAPIQTTNLNPTAFSPDGRRFVAGTINGIVKVWDVDTGKAKFQLAPMREVPVTRIEFSPDGTRIATGNSWGEVRLWDTATGQAVGPVIYHIGTIVAATFSPDGRYLLTASGDGSARVWDGHDASPVSEPVVTVNTIRSAAFSPDGLRFVTASNSPVARVWDTRTGQPVTEPMQHTNRLFEATFSPDGRFLLVEQVSSGFALWSVPPLGAAGSVPPWLLELATICASKTVDDDGQFVDASGEVAKIDEVRRTLATLPDNAPYVEWGRWFLSDRDTRSIAPGFSITGAEADRLAPPLAAPR